MTDDFPTYTDMKRTRVIERGSIYTMPRENAAIGSTQPIAKKEGLFEGISIGQIAASAAAAATSMLLASKIGIAGSVIGAAVSSAVTIVATQLYRRALSAGARKLQNATFEAVRRPVSSSPYGAQGARGQQGAYGEPGAHTPYAQAYTQARSARVAPTKLQARAAAQRAGTQRKIAIASVAVAAVTLALVTGIIMVATAGQGMGAKPQPIFWSQGAATAKPEDQGDAPAGSPDEPAAEQSQQGAAGNAGSDGDSAGQTPQGGADEGAQKPSDGQTGDTAGGNAPGDGVGAGGTAGQQGGAAGGTQAGQGAPGADGSTGDNGAAAASGR